MRYETKEPSSATEASVKFGDVVVPSVVHAPPTSFSTRYVAARLHASHVSAMDEAETVFIRRVGASRIAASSVSSQPYISSSDMQLKKSRWSGRIR